MKNIRSNCMTKPPCDWLGQRKGGGGWRGQEGGCQGMWGAEERGREERAGSFNSEVKHVVVGGAET